MPQDRMTAAELDAIAKVMREHQIVDFATADTRIILSANATIPVPGAPIEALKPIRATQSPLDTQNLSDEDEDLLFASAGGAPDV